MSELTYRGAGVDQRGADDLVSVFAALSNRASRPEVCGAVGGFAGLFDLGDGRALAMSTDGVGTKTELLRSAGLHRIAGWDAVAMNVDDVVCAGAEPVVCVDYVSIYPLDALVVEQIVTGAADACALAGCALVGGETSQHPGLMDEGAYDVVATVAGIVDLDSVWGPQRVRPGDAVVGLASSGLHSNGFSLIRRLIALGHTPPDGYLGPTRIYTRPLLDLGRSCEVHAAAHVTGGGIAGNLERVLPDGCGALLRRGSWPLQPVFEWLAGLLDREELEATFNCGLGMLVVAPDGDAVVARLAASGVESCVVGEITSTPGIRTA